MYDTYIRQPNESEFTYAGKFPGLSAAKRYAVKTYGYFIRESFMVGDYYLIFLEENYHLIQ